MIHYADIYVIFPIDLQAKRRYIDNKIVQHWSLRLIPFFPSGKCLEYWVHSETCSPVQRADLIKKEIIIFRMNYCLCSYFIFKTEKKEIKGEVHVQVNKVTL